MSSRGLRTFTARAVALMAMVLFAMTICGQEEHEEAAYTQAFINNCNDTPSGSPAVSLEVANAWIEGGSLCADLLVINDSESAIRLPRVNGCRPYWEVRFLKAPPPTISVDEESGVITITVTHDPEAWNELMHSACAGLPRIPICSIEELLEEKDIETIAPRQTGVLRAVHLGPFSSDPRTPASHVRWFEVTYNRWERILVVASTAEGLEKHLPEARAHVCSLYGRWLTSHGHILNP